MKLRQIITAFVTSITMIVSTLSCSVLIFSGPLSGDLPVGIGFGLVSLSVCSFVFSMFSRIRFAIAGPDAKPAAVLSTLSATVAAAVIARHHRDMLDATVLIALMAATFITGLTLAVFGALKTGRWIRFVPYPVIGGFLAASGWLLVAGGIRVLTDEPLSFDSILALGSSPHLGQLGSGLAFVVALVAIQRIKHPLALPGLLLGGTLIAHLMLHQAGYSLAEAQQSGWLLAVNMSAVIPNLYFSDALSHVDWWALTQASGEYLALIAVTASTLMLTVTAVEVAARIDADVDRELAVNGAANIAAGLIGGIVGTMSISRTLFNFSGTAGRGTGLVVAAVSFALLVGGIKILGYIPIPILGAILIQMGGAMLEEWLVTGFKRMQRADYIQVVVILLVIVRWNFIAGIALGLIAACVTFAINSSRVRLVKLGLDSSQYASRVDRPPHQHEELMRYGNGIQIMWLHGFVFFGSANRLFNHIKEIVAQEGPGVCRMIVLDFRQVLGIDSSAVLSFIKLRHFAERENITVILTALPLQVEKALHNGGFIGGASDPICKRFDDIDTALEWCEDRLLGEVANREDAVHSAEDWLAREIGGEAALDRLMPYLTRMEFQPGDVLFEQGAAPDSLYLLFSGRVSVILKLADDAQIRLRSMVRYTVIGEMGVYRAQPRGASIVIDLPSIVYRLSQEAMTRMEIEDPALSYAFHKFIIRTIASRLDFANHMVASLQR